MKKFLVSIIIFLCVAAVAGAVFLAYALQPYDGPESRRLYLPRDSSKEAIADSLETTYGSFGRAAYFLWRLRGSSPERAAGSYVAEPGMSAFTLARRISNGAQTPVRVTFSSIRTVADLASFFSRKLDMTPDEFLAACDSVLPPMGFKRPEYAAAFLPDTYDFYWSTRPDEAVRRLAEVRNRFWNENRREQARRLGLTPVQVATLASIVEEETNSRSERPTVARLYLNRLAKGMRLQADPTVKFVVGDPSLRRITGKHLAVESPYNTYLHAGLPPGPIRVADRRTLEAVLEAPTHPYIYMCAREDFSGTHRFATTFAEHRENARRYQAELNRRNIH